MRNAYTAQLGDLNADLCDLATGAEEAMREASRALLTADLRAAEEVIARGESLAVLGAHCEDEAVKVLALQAPVAADLRRVFSAVRISSDLARMVGLSVHVAEAARRRFPDPIVPEDLTEPFEEMARLCQEMCALVVQALRSSELDDIEELDRMDDRVDELKSLVVDRVVADDATNVVNAVDVALLGRYYERYADQIVDVASRIVFFVSGRKH
ncbi:phosphate signaling complex protein PhoU [Rhodococcoides corynebacterioides]|uniref:Phosphate-specific transport system accessory protein PhoU n=1 Tax=Rhodococcoides corynebacterioides TaxID=53972 RepID=A0ABS7P860_9NOCA|nr:phosphate signaling complex protein PhoU [Rhodococcus corynebacterioides]MBY6368573.1 phosphate signaling complex protein PhoU [Rhodococcus corynebacterioides]MBY6409660.1 phosphate signaling complex protein PhoU [Rhodococcus corynebacterioides]